MDPTEELKKQATEFVMAMCNPKASVYQIAFEGIQACLALYTVNNDFAAAQAGIQRLREMVANK